MILFRSDWKKYPTAIVDYNTSNESFLHLVYLYKKMGVENCEFPLALYQPELSGVDPYDENLSREMKLKISMEATYNPWYFFREVCRIPANSGTVPIQFKANRGNIALYWCFFNHIDFGLLQPRQTGKSVSTDCLMNGLINLWARSTTINLITKDIALRNNNVERLKEMRDLLPDYIYYPNRMDADNSELITNLKWGNRYKTSVGRNDRIAADKLGRGMTVPILHFDELAYINLIGASLPVALSSGSAARDEADDAGQPWGNIYTTTAGNINSRDGGYAYEFLTGGLPWSENLFDVSDQKRLAKIVDKGSSGDKPLIYAAFNHRQLGKSDKWLLRKLKETASKGELADRDYMNIWTTGTEGSPLTEEDKKAIQSSLGEPAYVELTEEGYALKWYIPQHEIAERMANGKFIMGIDPSEALGKNNDATGMVILDARTHDVICTGRYNETNLTTLTMFFTGLMERYENILLIPERKSSGSSMIDMMLIGMPRRGMDPFRRIYNRIVDDPDGMRTEYQEIQKPLSSRPAYFYDRYKRYFGYNTAGSGRNSRDALYSGALNSGVRIGGRRVYDQTLGNEMLSLTLRNNRIDHQRGNHDDMVISWLLAHWFCTQGRNLIFYGVDALSVFVDAETHTEEMTRGELYQRCRKQQQQKEFHKLVEELQEAEDPFVVSKLEMRLRKLSQTVDHEETGGVGIDAMIQQAREERGRKVKLQRYNSRVGMNRQRDWMRRVA